MATLDNAIWLTGPGGVAQDGSTVLTEGGNSTTVTGTFIGPWDGDANGTGVSQFGAFGQATPINATFEFSNPVENLSFQLEHVNSGGSTYDDMFTIRAYDEDGNLIPAATIIAGISGLNQDLVYANPDGSVTVEGEGGASNNVSVNIPGQVSELDITFGPGPDGSYTGGAGLSDLTFTIPEVMPCFVSGTLIETANGQTPVENIKTGDLVMTRDRGLMPVRWIGIRRIRCNSRTAPIVFQRGAIGNDQELRVSPQHRILLSGWKAQLYLGEEEVLCAAKHLVNGDTIYQDRCAEVTYVHILFDAHEVIRSNGAWTESFNPGKYILNAMGKETYDEITTLFPELLSHKQTGMQTARRILRQSEVPLLA